MQISFKGLFFFLIHCDSHAQAQFFHTMIKTTVHINYHKAPKGLSQCSQCFFSSEMSFVSLLHILSRHFHIFIYANLQKVSILTSTSRQ